MLLFVQALCFKHYGRFGWPIRMHSIVWHGSTTRFHWMGGDGNDAHFALQLYPTLFAHRLQVFPNRLPAMANKL